MFYKQKMKPKKCLIYKTLHMYTVDILVNTEYFRVGQFPTTSLYM